VLVVGFDTAAAAVSVASHDREPSLLAADLGRPEAEEPGRVTHS
jgi:hypothetical protein